MCTTTILPANVPAGAALAQYGSPKSAALTRGAAGEIPLVIVTPCSVKALPPVPVSVSVLWKFLLMVVAPTVVVHGDVWLMLPSPALPAAVATKTPAL